jgi:hypothetical protein
MSYLSLALLGAFHGLNPAMGWLFAVALGLQEGRRRAVLAAIPPIALGHAASVAAVVAFVGVAQLLVPMSVLRVAGGGGLVAFGLAKLLRGGHPRWVGMRVGFRDLTLWSFLMSSAHGAGLMLVPILLQRPDAARGAGDAHVAHAAVAVAPGSSAASGLTAIGVHTAALLVVMVAVAVTVFEVLGLDMLRRAWVNLDVVWAVALIGAGLVTVLM